MKQKSKLHFRENRMLVPIAGNMVSQEDIKFIKTNLKKQPML